MDEKEKQTLAAQQAAQPVPRRGALIDQSEPLPGNPLSLRSVWSFPWWPQSWWMR